MARHPFTILITTLVFAGTLSDRADDCAMYVNAKNTQDGRLSSESGGRGHLVAGLPSAGGGFVPLAPQTRLSVTDVPVSVAIPLPAGGIGGIITIAIVAAAVVGQRVTDRRPRL